MAQRYSIIIKQQDGLVTFTPDVLDKDRHPATAGQPLGVNFGDNVNWNNRTDLEITLKSWPPEGTPLCKPIPPGEASDYFNVTGDGYFGYYWVRQHAPLPAQADAWIYVKA
jgi:hypothetical protein